MTSMQPRKREAGNGAERQRRYRERKRQGVVCVARVPIYALDVETLVTHGRLAPKDENNAAKIAEATEDLVDDFTEEKLVPGGDG